MSQLLKLLITLLSLIATLPSPKIQASPIDPYNQPAPALAPENMINNNDPFSPSPSYEEDLSPEPQYPNDEEEQDMSPQYQYPSPSPSPSPLAYSPDIEEDYPYAANPSPSHSPSHAQEDVDDDDDYYYSPHGAPTPSPVESRASNDSTSDDVMAPQVDATNSPVLPFDYSGEEVISEDYDDEEGYPELKKKNRAVIGFVLGAICLVGLGGLVYKKQKNQKREYPMYMELSKKSDV